MSASRRLPLEANIRRLILPLNFAELFGTKQKIIKIKNSLINLTRADTIYNIDSICSIDGVFRDPYIP